MKTFFNWVAQNIALSFFLGVQAIGLIAALYWVVGLSVSDYLPKTVIESTDKIYVEESLRELIEDRMDMYTSTLPLDKHIKMYSDNEDQVINKLIADESNVIILSRQMTENEISNIVPTRLPINQEPVNVIQDSTESIYYIISDNQVNSLEAGFATTLKNEFTKTIATQKQAGKKANVG